MKLMYNNQGAYYGRNMGRWLWNAGKPGLDPTEPFYVENPSSSSSTATFIRKTNNSAPTITVEYSLDKITWQSLGSTSTSALRVDIPAGGKVWLRANAKSWGSEWGGIYYGHVIEGNIYFQFTIGGNIMSLLYGSNFTGNEKQFPDSSATWVFYGIFSNNGGMNGNLVDASKLILPATTLADGCYQSMFRGRTTLTTAPALPATTLAPACYQYMFDGCKGLTEAPALPATTLVNNCYECMFRNCKGLTEAPVFKVEDFGNSNSCKFMFSGCSNLNYIKCLATNPSDAFINYWVEGVASTGTFVKKAGVSWPSGSGGIPSGWTVVEE